MKAWFGGLRDQTDVYRIPVMDIHDYLVELDHHIGIHRILAWLSQETNGFGNKDKAHWRIEYHLGKQWYPEFVTDCRWLANSFVKTIPSFCKS